MVDSLAPIVVRLVLGLLIGFCIGLTGVGGGVLGLQAMTLVIGLDPIRAVGTTSLYICLTNISAVFHHSRLRTIDWKMVRMILVGAVPGVIVVSLWISGHGGDLAFERGLKWFIVAVVLFSVAVMTINLIAVLRGQAVASGKGPTRRFLDVPRVRALAAVVSGAVVGGLIGATSVGGGVLVVPILVLVFGLSASRTVGSSVTIAFVLTLLVAVIFGRGGELDVSTAVVMAVGSLGGVPLGSRLSVRMPDKVLRAVMVALIAFAAFMMLISLCQTTGV